MRYLVLVSHATLANGLKAALEMLMGQRDSMMAFGMEADGGPQAYRAEITERFSCLDSTDEVVLLADTVGGSPLMVAIDVLNSLGFEGRYVAFGGANLPMAISALMANEEELALDALCDSVLAEGRDAVIQVV